MPAQGRVLRDLANLELQCPSVVNDTAAMPAQPGEHRTDVLGAVTVSPGVRRRAHPVVEDAVRRLCAQIEHSLIEKPLFERKASFVQTLAERFDPCFVLMKDEICPIAQPFPFVITVVPLFWHSPVTKIIDA